MVYCKISAMVAPLLRKGTYLLTTYFFTYIAKTAFKITSTRMPKSSYRSLSNSIVRYTLRLVLKPKIGPVFNDPYRLVDINSSFIKLSVYISTANVASHLRPLTTLFLDALFTLPIQTKDGLIPYEDVVKRLSEDTVDYYASLGTSVGFREVAMIGIKVEVSRKTFLARIILYPSPGEIAYHMMSNLGCQVC